MYCAALVAHSMQVFRPRRATLLQPGLEHLLSTICWQVSPSRISSMTFPSCKCSLQSGNMFSTILMRSSSVIAGLDSSCNPLVCCFLSNDAHIHRTILNELLFHSALTTRVRLGRVDSTWDGLNDAVRSQSGYDPRDSKAGPREQHVKLSFRSFAAGGHYHHVYIQQLAKRG